MTDDSHIEQNVVTAVISPADILEDKPGSVPDGSYLARLADDGVGGPSYVVLPFREGGLSADRISIDGGEQYARTAINGNEIMYRARGTDTATAWSSRS